MDILAKAGLTEPQWEQFWQLQEASGINMGDFDLRIHHEAAEADKLSRACTASRGKTS